MSDIAIRAEGIGKTYRIDHQSSARYRTLRDSLASFAAHPLRGLNKGSHETMWALRDVSFEVRRGEALGIIGRNGAGKSTLLKILSRVTRPTAGRAEVFGTLGSLLEVGTGFHPELTGRENVYLNGAILGMNRREVQARFDEIVAFAETERFLDTPVKHYSTGMYTRLAFAVAAHLRSDILVVDEVLAVGDAEFQQKCMGKMGDATQHGRTVLFVSHNLASVSQLCTNGVLLDHGTVAAQGPIDAVVAQYTSGASHEGRIVLGEPSERGGTGGATFTWAEIRDNSRSLRTDFSIGETIVIRFGMRPREDLPRTTLAVVVHTADGLPVAHALDADSRFSLEPRSGEATISVAFGDIRLYPGTYRVTLRAVNAANTELFDLAEDCLTFRIVDGGKLTMRWLPRHTGLVFLTPEWQAENAR
jgi:lipopolysaccharide transport system ATP-binding protein